MRRTSTYLCQKKRVTESCLLLVGNIIVVTTCLGVQILAESNHAETRCVYLSGSTRKQFITCHLYFRFQRRLDSPIGFRSCIRYFSGLYYRCHSAYGLVPAFRTVHGIVSGVVSRAHSPLYGAHCCRLLPLFP